MATPITTTAQSAVVSKFTRVTALDNAATTANASAGSVKQVRLENGSGTQDVYFKAYNNAAPTIGTTAPNVQYKGKAGKITEVTCVQGMAFGTAITFAGVTEKGTAGTTNPSVSCGAKIGHT